MSAIFTYSHIHKTTLTFPTISSNKSAPKLHQSHAAVSSAIPPTSTQHTENVKAYKMKLHRICFRV